MPSTMVLAMGWGSMMIDTLTNTECLAPLQEKLYDHMAYLRWCKKEGLDPEHWRSLWRWSVKKFDEMPNPWFEWMRASAHQLKKDGLI